MARIIRKDGPGKKKLERMLRDLGNYETKTGFMESSKYEDGTPVAYVATIQEFGDPTRSIPPRSFMRTTISEQRNNWNKLSEQLMRSVSAGKISLEQAMDMLGQQAAGDIRHMISQIQEPPLTQTTLRIRKLKQQGVKIGGKVVGQAHQAVNTVGPRMRGDKSADVSGVSTKPLVFDGILINSVTSVTEKK